MIDVKIIKKPKKRASSGYSGGGIVTPATSGGDVLEAAHAKEADYAALADKANYAAESGHANEADHAKSAHDLDADSPANDRFVHKDKSDRTPYGLSVGGRLKAEDWAHFGEFVSGFINGKGAGIGPAGDSEV